MLQLHHYTFILYCLITVSTLSVTYTIILACIIIWYLKVLFKINSIITIFSQNITCGGEKDININVEIIYLRSITSYVSFSIKIYKNNILYVRLFLKHFNIWYTSKTYGASAKECPRNKVLQSYSIHLPISGTTRLKVHHDTKRPFSKAKWYLPPFWV